MKAFRSRKLFRVIQILIILFIFFAGLAYAAINIWPSLGAATVDVLREIFGDQLVAIAEDAVLKTQDNARQLAYQVAGNSSELGWGAGGLQPAVEGKTDWLPPAATALSKKKNEAVWQPFINAKGRVVAYKTLIAPDPQRPYAFAAVIAFDLENTRLHFLLGTQEPKSEVQIARSGRIPVEDRKAGWLLAAFNGGFKAEHGHFGVMVEGVTILPAQKNLGTVGLYSDGKVRMGLLGKEVPETQALSSWRQNGPLIIQDGAINPLTNSNDPKDWGYVVSSDTATYRSAMAISQDGRTLYFVVGPDLTLPALARALAAVRAYQAIQLDINNFWAHFESFTLVGADLKAVPLLDFMKNVDDQRFLGSYLRDYFYVTAR
jgi:hypothetical protein